jgi:hypothetical protein
MEGEGVHTLGLTDIHESVAAPTWRKKGGVIDSGASHRCRAQGDQTHVDYVFSKHTGWSAFS